MSNSFKLGYEYVAQNLAGADAYNVSEEWINSIEEAIDYDGLEKAMVRLAEDKNTGASYLQGNIAEIWHTGTFNTSAKINKTGSKAECPDVNYYGSVDIQIKNDDNSTIDFSSKSYTKYDGAIRDQAKTPWEDYNHLRAQAARKGKDYESFEEFLKERNLDPDKAKYSKYYGQGKIISADQIDAGRNYLENKISTLESRTDVDPAQIHRYQEVLDTLDSVIKDGKGAESLELTHNQAVELAKAAKEGDISEDLFKECGLDINKLISNEDIAKEALSAGLNAAVMTFVISIAPVIVDGISMLISEGEIETEQLAEGEINALKGTAKGFITGSITAALVTGCKTGKFGPEFVDINTKAVSSLVIAAVGTLCVAIRHASGKIDKTEMAKELLQLYIVTASAYVGGIALQSLLHTIPCAYMLGSLIGGVVGGFVYKGVDYLLMSYCVDSGCTFFGLVEQDYALPEDSLESLGLEQIAFDKLDIDEFSYSEFNADQFNYAACNYETIGIHVLRRDLIGVSTIGYM